jgi:hypothetical protein
MHDDGVGTRDFVLFKLLGGAFGWGKTGSERNFS